MPTHVTRFIGKCRKIFTTKVLNDKPNYFFGISYLLSISRAVNLQFFELLFKTALATALKFSASIFHISMKFTIVLYLESPVLAVSQCHKTSGSRFRRANNFGEEEWRAEGVVVTSRCLCV